MSFGPQINWKNIQQLRSKAYTCGYCNAPIASERGFEGDVLSGVRGESRVGEVFIYICHQCGCPTYFRGGEQTPGICHGLSVDGITDAAVRDLYDEARRATSANCNTAAVLCCRKLLMHVAVAKGAKEGESFASYVDYLASKGYVPPDAMDCVDHVRRRANEANHEINIMKSDDAEELLDYMGILLKLIYEYPATMRKRHPPSQAE